ncbi:ATP-binding cassette domain-containing protein [Verticiella sediminum]|uniref:ATP-binding cassette domain-containing protein n=1 Tax=Verticiella sediminum TaxID=1247510 RepID=A0A556B320_9BURK|nr:oligopeptide/dipeptide ABC transporter ATP-binding protein [Verticiella sediminum]TSH99245.1 ATP-binding cassette domain-containing protein [Verticiella sediminum]
MTLACLSPETGPLLEVRHIVKTYPARGARRVQAVSDVSFDLARGETLGIVGESGSGKSTLARALLALPHPDSGSVSLAGSPVLAVGKAHLRELRRQMQMVFQDPLSSLNPAQRVFDIVEMPLVAVGGYTRPERRRLAGEALASVGLDPARFGQRKPYEISGGQCQRVSIARALVLDPRLLVCDEPVSALDVSVQAQVLNLLEDIKDARALTLLFISHDLSVVRGISDRVMVMYLGKVCEIAPTQALYANPRHPYTATLLDAVPTLEPSRRSPSRPMVRGETPSPLNMPSGCRFRTRCPRAEARCAAEEPPLRALADGAAHQVACHFPLAGHAGVAGDASSARRHATLHGAGAELRVAAC